VGFLKQVKSELVADHARRAAEEGRKVFVLRVNPGTFDSGFTGPVNAFAEQIEAVEGAGWTLATASFTGDDKKASGYFIFRRAGEGRTS
jgi:hypothetical protein